MTAAPTPATTGTGRISAVVGPHDLVISHGDCEFYAACSCGAMLGQPIRPSESLNKFGDRWERHVMADHRGCDCEPCSW